MERRGGWNRKSAATHKAMGTFRKDRHGKKETAPVTDTTAKPFSARMPNWLDADARACWRRTLKETRHRLKDEDVDVLTSMCVHFSLWRQAVATLQAEGAVVVVKGVPKRSPLVQIVGEYQRTYLAAAKYLGVGEAGHRNRTTMTPAEALGAMSLEQLQEAAQIAREREGIAGEDNNEDNEGDDNE